MTIDLSSINLSNLLKSSKDIVLQFPGGHTREHRILRMSSAGRKGYFPQEVPCQLPFKGPHYCPSAVGAKTNSILGWGRLKGLHTLQFSLSSVRLMSCRFPPFLIPHSKTGLSHIVTVPHTSTLSYHNIAAKADSSGTKRRQNSMKSTIGEATLVTILQDSCT